MTVRREQNEVFGKPLELVRQALRKILDKNRESYRYYNTEMSADGATFNTIIRPRTWPVMLQTYLSVQLVSVSDGSSTKVIIGTKSQWLVLGDIFGYYDGYVRDVLVDLRDELDTVA